MSLRDAAILAKRGELEAAWKIVGAYLNDDPWDGPALTTGSYILLRLGALPQAYHLAKAATQVLPEDCSTWTNLGHAASQMWLIDDAESCYMKSLSFCKDQESRIINWLNLAALYLDVGRFDDSMQYVNRILAIEPDRKTALANLGFCQLAVGNWKEGWKNYRHTIGSPWRPATKYHEEPEWDGTPGKTVVLYGEQGLGDEISFASVIPDAASVCSKLIVECEERLGGLFKRSFPQAKIYATRRAKTGKWDKEDWQIDASLPIGQACEYFRTEDSQFTGEPYLLACPQRVAMWKGLFAGKLKPTIGIAWSGGQPRTNQRNRTLTLDDFLPLMQSIDAHWVSLQYKDASAEIEAFKARHHIDIEQYKWGTLTQDYDDTAALIAACDYVVCIQTAVAHTAGALGVPVSVLIPQATQWRYGIHNESILWYKSLRIVRQSGAGWKPEIQRLKRDLKAYFPRVPGAATHPAPDSSLRNGLDRVRTAGVQCH